MKRVGHADSDRQGCRALAACVLALSAFSARPAAAQVAMQVPVADVDEQTQPQKNTGFSIKKEDQKVIEQIEDFERYRDKKAWDRAFKSLSAVLDTKDTGGLAPTKDGFWVPTRQRLMQTLITLPPEGKEAYRLFNDAKAKQQWDQIVAHEAAGDADTLPLLKKLVEQFPITAVGDKAADHLGDALMESGDYTGAARAYDTILQARPDTDLPPLRIQIKRATALARAGRMDSFRELAAQIREKHAGESVKVAGKDLAVEEFLSTLSAAPTTKPSTTAPSTANSETPEPSTPISLSSATTRPAWRSVFLDQGLHDKIAAQLANNGWMAQQMGGVVNVSPAAATDGKRIFLNWYGTVWALDAQTGKILWWSGHFAQLGDKINEMAQWQIEQRRFSITVAGDNVLTVALRLDRLNQQEPYRLNCLEPATGKKKWSSESGPLSNWAFIGQPTVVDGTIYVAAHPRNAQDMHALAVNLADGKLLWEAGLGQPQVANNWRGMPIYPLPVLKLVGGTLYVMTNNGAVIAFDTASRQVLWAFSYETIFKGGNENGGMVFWNGMPQAQTPAQPPGAALLREGVLYFKDADGSAIYALDLSGPKLLFRRPVDEEQLLANVDDAGFCLVGPTFSLIDAKTRTLTWAPALPVTADAMKPARAGDDYLIFTGRGIYQINPAKQSIEIFRGFDLESVGGSLLRAGDKLIAISNLSVTAYDVGRSTTASR